MTITTYCQQGAYVTTGGFSLFHWNRPFVAQVSKPAVSPISKSARCESRQESQDLSTMALGRRWKGKIDSIVWKIGNTATILDSQRLNRQQNRQQFGNKPATFSYICPGLAKFDHPRRLLGLGFSKFPPVLIRVCRAGEPRLRIGVPEYCPCNNAGVENSNHDGCRSRQRPRMVFTRRSHIIANLGRPCASFRSTLLSFHSKLLIVWAPVAQLISLSNEN